MVFIYGIANMFDCFHLSRVLLYFYLSRSTVKRNEQYEAKKPRV